MLPGWLMVGGGLPGFIRKLSVAEIFPTSEAQIRVDFGKQKPVLRQFSDIPKLGAQSNNENGKNLAGG